MADRSIWIMRLQGDIATILEWIERTGKPGYRPGPDLPTSRLSTSVKTRASQGVAGSATRLTATLNTRPVKGNGAW